MILFQEHQRDFKTTQHNTLHLYVIQHWHHTQTPVAFHIFWILIYYISLYSAKVSQLKTIFLVIFHLTGIPFYVLLSFLTHVTLHINILQWKPVSLLCCGVVFQVGKWNMKKIITKVSVKQIQNKCYNISQFIFHCQDVEFQFWQTHKKKVIISCKQQKNKNSWMNRKFIWNGELMDVRIWKWLCNMCSDWERCFELIHIFTYIGKVVMNFYAFQMIS